MVALVTDGRDGRGRTGRTDRTDGGIDGGMVALR